VELDDLYQEIILDHYRNPRHARKLGEAEALVDEENPTCGDHIKLTARLDHAQIADVGVDCQGCAICTASASIMSEMVIGKPVEHARRLIQRFTALMRGEGQMSDDELGDLVALRGVTRYPLRVKCATMSWHALEAALKKLGA
jgi:nitrogen fixation protein NifU and related proteins